VLFVPPCLICFARYGNPFPFLALGPLHMLDRLCATPKTIASAPLEFSRTNPGSGIENYRKVLELDPTTRRNITTGAGAQIQRRCSAGHEEFRIDSENWKPKWAKRTTRWVRLVYMHEPDAAKKELRWRWNSTRKRRGAPADGAHLFQQMIIRRRNANCPRAANQDPTRNCIGAGLD